MTESAAVRIYEPMAPDGVEWVLMDRDDGQNRLLDIGTQPVKKSWTPLPVHLLASDERTGRPLVRSQLPWLGRHVLVLRDEAIDALGPMLEPFGELLPLSCSNATLMLVHMTNVVDALDETESEIVRFPSSERVMKIAIHSFKANVVRRGQAFKLPQMPRGSIYLTDDLVHAIGAFGFEGTGFRLVGEASVG